MIQIDASSSQNSRNPSSIYRDSTVFRDPAGKNLIIIIIIIIIIITALFNVDLRLTYIQNNVGGSQAFYHEANGEREGACYSDGLLCHDGL